MLFYLFNDLRFKIFNRRWRKADRRLTQKRKQESNKPTHRFPPFNA
jgi:hypothetical protein